MAANKSLSIIRKHTETMIFFSYFLVDTVKNKTTKYRFERKKFILGELNVINAKNYTLFRQIFLSDNKKHLEGLYSTDFHLIYNSIRHEVIANFEFCAQIVECLSKIVKN